MAIIQGNTRVLCLMALLMISTTLLSSQAAGRNIVKHQGNFCIYVPPGCLTEQQCIGEPPTHYNQNQKGSVFDCSSYDFDPNHNSSRRKQLPYGCNPELHKGYVLIALLTISTTLFASQASGRIGMEANTGGVGTEARSGPYREPYVGPTCAPKFCNAVCKRDKYSVGNCHGDDGGCWCN